MNTKHCIFTQGVRVVGRGLIYLLGITCAAHLMTAAAADIWWTNTSGGNWNVAANWSPNQVPGTLDNAFVTGSSYTVSVTDTEAAGNLIINGATANFTGSASMSVNTLVLSSGAVNFNNSGANAAAVVNLSAGTLGGTSLVMVSGPLNWTEGTILGVVEFNGGTFSQSDPGHTLDLYGGQLINNGTLSWTGGQMRTGNGSIINNLANGIINLTPNSVASADFGGTYVFNNAGQVTMTGSGTATIGDTFNNSGTLDVESGTVDLNGQFNLTGGTLNFGISSLTSYGQLYLGESPSPLTGTLAAHLNNGSEHRIRRISA